MGESNPGVGLLQVLRYGPKHRSKLEKATPQDAVTRANQGASASTLLLRPSDVLRAQHARSLQSDRGVPTQPQAEAVLTSLTQHIQECHRCCFVSFRHLYLS